jgi:predicted LPLAT superfamily acyltransferase
MRLGLLNARKGLLQVLLPTLKRLPPRAAARVVGGLGRAEYAMNPGLRRRYDGATARAAAHFGIPWDAPDLARRLVGNELRWRVRDHLLDGRPDDQVEPLLTAAGRGHLDAALARGRGAVLLFNHFGAFLMPAHWLVRHGYRLRWLTERPRNVSRLLSRDFGEDGPDGQARLFMSRHADPAEGATSVRRAVRLLKSGWVVQIAGDVRWGGPRAAAARFLGRRYTFSTTWVTLAALSGAPVVPAFGMMREDGSCRVEFQGAFDVPPEAARGHAGEYVQAYLDRLEDRVRAHPDNSSDYFFWAETGEFAVGEAG